MDISKISAGNPPEELNVVIEIPQGSSIKYEVDKDSGAVFVDRFSFTAFSYPFNYGFVPQTLSPDGDPLDVLVISVSPVHPGTVVVAKPIGMLEMEDESGVDTKIIAVPFPKADPFNGDMNDIQDLPDAVKNKIKHFMEHYKDLEKGKWVKVGNFLPKAKALEEIKKSLKG